MSTRNYQPIRRTLNSSRPVSRDTAGNALLVHNGYYASRASLVMHFVITASEWEVLLAELPRSYGFSPFDGRGRANLNRMEPVSDLMQKPMRVCREVLSR